nr:serine/arginine repetitive matrix protein 1-like [Procambarus clarkii]
MVAGGVQSVEDGALYTTHASYYPQFYSTLLPPAPPGSYSSSNYSSSTHSSSGQSSDCSWLRLEGVEGVCGTAPPGRARHPRCTCPSPESLRKARKALAARRVRAWRDPRCTCPSPPGSRDASPWSGTSPSPPSTPATASPPPRQPRCTCPDSDLSHKLTGARRARSARDLRCTCPTTTPPPAREPRCTCPPHVQEQDKRSCKGRLVHAVLLNYPGSTAISTDHGDFVRLSPAKMAEALKLCHLRHKVVSGVAALAAARPLHAHGKDGDGRVCRCEASEARLRGRAPGVVTRILPAAAAADTKQETKASPEAPTKGNATFPMEDLPQPLLGDLCSPLGEVPPLSPPERPPVTQDNLPLHPLTRHVTSDVTQASCSSTPTKAATRGGGSWRDPSVSLRNLRHLQQLSASHGHLDASLEASLSRTRSLEIYVKDLAQQAARQPPSLLAAASAYHLTLAPQTDQQRWTKKILPQSPPPGRRQSPPPGRRQSPPPGRRQSPHPQQETVATPRQETVATPRQETVAIPRQETVVTPREETVATPGRRQSPPPGKRQSPPPGRRQSPPPGRRQSPPPGRRQSPPPGRRQSPPPGRRQSPPPDRRQSPPPAGDSRHPPARDSRHPPAGDSRHPPAGDSRGSARYRRRA